MEENRRVWYKQLWFIITVPVIIIVILIATIVGIVLGVTGDSDGDSTGAIYNPLPDDLDLINIPGTENPAIYTDAYEISDFAELPFEAEGHIEILAYASYETDKLTNAREFEVGDIYKANLTIAISNLDLLSISDSDDGLTTSEKHWGSDIIIWEFAEYVNVEDGIIKDTLGSKNIIMKNSFIDNVFYNNTSEGREISYELELNIYDHYVLQDLKYNINKEDGIHWNLVIDKDLREYEAIYFNDPDGVIFLDEIEAITQLAVFFNDGSEPYTIERYAYYPKVIFDQFIDYDGYPKE